jgi:hypothetical protein
VDSGIQIIGDRPDPVRAPQLNYSEIVDLQRDGAFPASDTPSNTVRLEVAAQLELNVGPNRLVQGGELPRLLSITGAASYPFPTTPPPGQATPAPNPGCVLITPSGPGSRASLRFVGPAAPRVNASLGGTMQIFMGDDTQILDEGRSFSMPRGDDVYLNVSAPSSSLVLEMPPGVDTICGLAQ